MHVSTVGKFTVYAIGNGNYGPSSQTALLFHDTTNKTEPENWTLIAGRETLGNLVKASKAFLSEVIAMSSSANSMRRNIGGFKFELIFDSGWKVYVNFYGRGPLDSAQGTDKRFRVYPGSILQVKNYLSAVAALPLSPPVNLLTLPYDATWIYPNKLLINSDEAPTLSEELENRAKALHTCHPVVGPVLAKIFKREWAIKVELMRCPSCGHNYTVPKGEYWRELCVGCYKAKIGCK